MDWFVPFLGHLLFSKDAYAAYASTWVCFLQKTQWTGMQHRAVMMQSVGVIAVHVPAVATPARLSDTQSCLRRVWQAAAPGAAAGAFGDVGALTESLGGGRGNLLWGGVLGMGQNQTTRGPQLSVHVSIYQGNPFWVPIFDPQPFLQSSQPPAHSADVVLPLLAGVVLYPLGI